MDENENVRNTRLRRKNESMNQIFLSLRQDEMPIVRQDRQVMDMRLLDRLDILSHSWALPFRAS